MRCLPLRLTAWQRTSLRSKCIVAIATIFVAVSTVDSVARNWNTPVRNLPDARTRLQAAGFFCVCDEPAEGRFAGFLVSRTPITRLEVTSLCKVGPMGSAWHGKVWVTISTHDWTLLAVPDDAPIRVWNDVVAFGDEALLEEIERVLKP